MNELTYALIFLIALLYSSVGHGGASGYLAVLALSGFAPEEMAASALALNILVAGTSFLTYWRADYFDPKILWPFALTSIPMALLGGFLIIPPKIYAWLLLGSLAFAALRLALAGLRKTDHEVCRPPSWRIALPVGAGIGLLSGIVGVGGGIFLSPIIILMRWADAKGTAAVSAAFILVNSLAALFGHLSRPDRPVIDLWPLVLAAFVGGLFGSRLGARRFERVTLRRVLAGVLGVAAYKMFLIAT